MTLVKIIKAPSQAILDGSRFNKALLVFVYQTNYLSLESIIQYLGQ
jgi:hypothetical protein